LKAFEKEILAGNKVIVFTELLVFFSESKTKQNKKLAFPQRLLSPSMKF
jgi:hypothetical protein